MKGSSMQAHGWTRHRGRVRASNLKETRIRLLDDPIGHDGDRQARRRAAPTPLKGTYELEDGLRGDAAVERFRHGARLRGPHGRHQAKEKRPSVAGAAQVAEQADARAKSRLKDPQLDGAQHRACPVTYPELAKDARRLIL